MLLEVDTLVAFAAGRDIRIKLTGGYICCRSYSTSAV